MPDLDAPYRPYGGRPVWVEPYYFVDEVGVCFYRAYPFRDYLAKKGFYWDGAAKAWVGYVSPDLFEGEVGRRLWESIPRRARLVLLEIMGEAVSLPYGNDNA